MGRVASDAWNNSAGVCTPTVTGALCAWLDAPMKEVEQSPGTLPRLDRLEKALRRRPRHGGARGCLKGLGGGVVNS